MNLSSAGNRVPQDIGLNYEMNDEEFRKYVNILQSGLFVLYPNPEHMDSSDRFEFIGFTETHAFIKRTRDNKQYSLPLVLVEFANPGEPVVLRLTRRDITIFGGLTGTSFV
jgi:hypothetical protein